MNLVKLGFVLKRRPTFCPSHFPFKLSNSHYTECCHLPIMWTRL